MGPASARRVWQARTAKQSTARSVIVGSTAGACLSQSRNKGLKLPTAALQNAQESTTPPNPSQPQPGNSVPLTGGLITAKITRFRVKTLVTRCRTVHRMNHQTCSSMPHGAPSQPPTTRAASPKRQALPSRTMQPSLSRTPGSWACCPGRDNRGNKRAMRPSHPPTTRATSPRGHHASGCHSCHHKLYLSSSPVLQNLSLSPLFTAGRLAQFTKASLAVPVKPWSSPGM